MDSYEYAHKIQFSNTKYRVQQHKTKLSYPAMKFTIVIATTLPLLQSSQAIYLACCQTTKECPQNYNTVDTKVNWREGGLTVSACCYPDEEERTEDLPECVHPVMTEGGVGISVMSLPQTKLEGANETTATSTLLEEITITEGNEEITIEVTSLEESQDVDSTEESTEEASTATEEKETETAPYGCCAVASSVSALRSKAQSSSSVCPKDMHHVDGFTINLSLLEGAKTNMQVCCDVETQAEDVDVEAVLPCSNDEVVLDHTNADDTSAANDEKDTVESKNEANALNAEDDSNSASGFGSVAFGIAALCVAVQAVL